MAGSKSTTKPELVAGMGHLSREETARLVRGDIVSVDIGDGRGFLRLVVAAPGETLWEGGQPVFTGYHLLSAEFVAGEESVRPRGIFFTAAEKIDDVEFDVIVSGIPAYVPLAHTRIEKLSGRITESALRRFERMECETALHGVSKNPPDWWEVVHLDVSEKYAHLQDGVEHPEYEDLTPEEREWDKLVAELARSSGG